MQVIDENLPASQRQLLRKWRIHFRAVGVDIAAPGASDENLFPVWFDLTPALLRGRIVRRAVENPARRPQDEGFCPLP
jgi:hypothetical protein